MKRQMMDSLPLDVLIPLVLSAAAGAILVYGTLHITGALARQSKPHSMEFRFSNRELVGACRAAQNSFSPEDLDGSLYERLLTQLSSIFPGLKTRIESSSAHSDQFVVRTSTHEGPIKVEVEILKDSLILRLTGLRTPLAQKHLVDSKTATEQAEELSILRDAVTASPFPTWREQADGKIEWANQAYHDLCTRAKRGGGGNPNPIFHGGHVTSTGEQPKVKRANVSLQDGGLAAFDVLRLAQKDYTLNFATDATTVIKAEDALRQFMQTLTRTFATLPIGLAVFDRNRNLVMFNPALVDLTTIDPSWLTARPSLHDMLDQLRELRMVPEQRNFGSWRGKIADLEKSAVNGTYCETWSLPNGQTYRFTGQPHPEGAVAFLMEDITAEIALTRKFRRELALSQTLIDQLPHAMVVFGADGVIAMTNHAYHVLWNTDAEDAIDQLTITDATRLWQENSMPNPVWGDARDFATQGGERVEWSDKVLLNSGRHVDCRFQPLAGGATLVEFELVQLSKDTANQHKQLTAISV